MDSNATLLQKADFTLAQLVAGGNTMPVEHAEKFIELAIAKPVMIQQVDVSPMDRQQMTVNKLRFSGHVLRAGTEATALGVPARAVPALGTYSLTTQLYKSQVTFSDEVLEDQIERGSFKDTVMRSLAEAVGRDVEWLAIQSNTTTVVTDLDTQVLQLQNGWLALASAHTVAGAGAALGADLLFSGLEALPQEWRTDRQSLRFFTNVFASDTFEHDERGRATAAGDRIFDGNWTPQYGKVPVVAVPMFPNDIGGAGVTAVLLTNPKNLKVGIQRQMTLEWQRDVPASSLVVVLRTRMAFAIEETDATSRIDAVDGQ